MSLKFNNFSMKKKTKKIKKNLFKFPVETEF